MRVSKFFNKPTAVDGIVFDSKREATRYGELKILQQAGIIQGLGWHVVYPLVVNGKKVCSYEADFVYVQGVKQVVEDVKSAMTRKNRAYRIKKKLFEAVYGLEIVEV